MIIEIQNLVEKRICAPILYDIFVYNPLLTERTPRVQPPTPPPA